MDKNYYEILGITEEEKKLNDEEFGKILSKKYKKLCIQWHPDKWVNGTEDEKKNAEEKFKEINEANSVLSDPQKRRNYDNGGSDFDFNGFDPFEHFRGHFGGFGDLFGGMGRQTYQERGEDVEVVVDITLSDIINGGSKEITYTRYVRCSACNGTGSKDGKVITCKHCGGTGFMKTVKRNGNTIFQQMVQCPHCHGMGKMNSDPCKKCNGTGFEKETVKKVIDIPVGIFNGGGIELQGEGNETKSIGGINGNLIIIFREHIDPKFKKEGGDILYELNLDLDEAWCGTEKEIPTADGSKIKIKIPELSENGKLLRLTGKGVPCLNSGVSNVGDMFVRILYKMPKSINEKQKDLIKEFYDRSF